MKKGRRVANASLMVVYTNIACSRPIPAVSSSRDGARQMRWTRFNRVAHAVDRIPNRMRKIPTEKQKLEERAVGS